MGDRISLIEAIRSGSKTQKLTYVENGKKKTLTGNSEEIIKMISKIQGNPEKMKWLLIKNLRDG